MKKQVTKKVRTKRTSLTKNYISLITAILILFIAMWSPLTSFALAILFLIAYIIIRKKN